MSSVIHYKFKNTNKWDSITFQGSVISISDIKKHIYLSNNLIDSNNTCKDELLISDATSGEVYHQDGFLISKNTMLLVKRTPAIKGSTITIYKDIPDNVVNKDKDLETDKMKNLIKKAITEPNTLPNPSISNPASNITSNKPPIGYICHRCHNPGHYITNCPLLYQEGNKHNTYKPKAPSGIPKSFLTNVKNDNINLSNSNSTVDNFSKNKGVYRTADGKLAVAQLNTMEWNMYASNNANINNIDNNNNKINTSIKTINNSDNIPERFICTLCHHLYTLPIVVTNCCSTSFCKECLYQYINTNTADKKCPFCSSPLLNIEEETKENLGLENLIKTFLERNKNISQSNKINSTTESLTDEKSGNVATSPPYDNSTNENNDKQPIENTTTGYVQEPTQVPAPFYCAICHQHGHLTRECPNKKNANKPHNRPPYYYNNNNYNKYPQYNNYPPPSVYPMYPYPYMPPPNLYETPNAVPLVNTNNEVQRNESNYSESKKRSRSPDDRDRSRHSPRSSKHSSSRYHDSNHSRSHHSSHYHRRHSRSRSRSPPKKIKTSDNDKDRERDNSRDKYIDRDKYRDRDKHRDRDKRDRDYDRKKNTRSEKDFIIRADIKKGHRVIT